MAEKQEIVFKEGVPDWLVTFGDMMSLLLTFFILLFSVSEIREQSKIYDLIVTFQGKVHQKRPVYGYILPRLEMSPDGLMRDIEKRAGEIGEAGVSTKKVSEPEGEHTQLLSIDTDLYLRLAGSVLFDEGESFLVEEGRRILNGLVRGDLAGGRFRVVVLGHVSRNEARNDVQGYWLGYRRARSIRDYLVRLGVPENAVEVQSASYRQPVRADSNTLEALALDRRVQILISPRTVGAAPEG